MNIIGQIFHYPSKYKYVPFDPHIPLLDIYSTEKIQLHTHAHTQRYTQHSNYICSKILVAALFVEAKYQKYCKCPSTNVQMGYDIFISTTHCTVLKRNEADLYTRA